MNIERDKFLTEAMGECWHEKSQFYHAELVGGGYWKCYKCNGSFYVSSFNDEINLDFSTWQGFGKLWEWANQQEWRGEFIGRYLYLNRTKQAIDLIIELIHPDRFADAVYEFLKGEK